MSNILVYGKMDLCFSVPIVFLFHILIFLLQIISENCKNIGKILMETDFENCTMPMINSWFWWFYFVQKCTLLFRDKHNILIFLSNCLKGESLLKQAIGVNANSFWIWKSTEQFPIVLFHSPLWYCSSLSIILYAWNNNHPKSFKIYRDKEKQIA